MATLTTVRLTKGECPTWGFRLQGGKDFGTPLVIQKVNGGSPAERAGLIAGDAVIKINNVDVFNRPHKEAQDVIVRAGNNFEMVIQRGGSTWKPAVVPTGGYSKPSQSIDNVTAVTKTSLTAQPGQNYGAIGTGHNLAAKPYAPQVNGAVNGGGAPKYVNKQYNTPLKLYSEDAIAETISAQSEVLPTGALGVNFKKNEKNYDATNSAVYRMLQEAENDGPTNEPVTRWSQCQSAINSIPESKSVVQSPSLESDLSTATICTDCERVIVGVFVRIKEKNLHVECFKCSTCGSSLKNVGYYNIANKLYCDIHAKAAAIAINNPTAAPLSPPLRNPASAISSALGQAPLSPKIPTYPSVDIVKLSQPPTKSSSNCTLFNPATPVSFSNYINKSNNYGAPKPFGSVNAPLSPGGGTTLPRAGQLSPGGTLPRGGPLSPPTKHSFAAPYSSTTERIVWPPQQEDDTNPDLPTACPLFYPPPSKVEPIKKKRTQFEQEYFAADEDETMSFYSEEFSSVTGRRSATECVELLTEHLETQKLIESVVVKSPPHVEISAAPEPVKVIDNVVPQKWESSLTQALRTTAPDEDTFNRIPTSRRTVSPMAAALSIAPSQPFNRISSSHGAVSLPEETVPYFPPEHPLEINVHEEEKKKVEKLPIPKPYSPFVKALEIAPDRPFSPVGGPAPAPVKKKPQDPLDKLLEDLPMRPTEPLDMRTALTTAPERPYTPLVSEQVEVEKRQSSINVVDRSQLIRPVKPEELPDSFKMNVKRPQPPSYYPPAVLEERIQSETTESQKSTLIERQPSSSVIVLNQPAQEFTQQPCLPIFQGFSCSFKNKGEHSQFSVDVCTTPPVPTPPPKPQTPVQYVATVEERPACVKISQQENFQQQSFMKQDFRHQEQAICVTEEQRTHQESVKQQCLRKTENFHQQKIAKERDEEVLKQNEEIVQVKAFPVATILHKPDSLPGYQLDLKAAAEADLLLMERKRRAEERLKKEEQELKPPPTIKVDEANCKPISPLPRPVTPSMIHKAPPLLPYYQDNLVPQYQGAVEANLFDPTQPNISRSPSPCPMLMKDQTRSSRSPSPCPARAKSPAPGPPPNPLSPSHDVVLPTPEASRLKVAKESLQSSLVKYQNQMEIKEQNKYSQNVAYPVAGSVNTGNVQHQISGKFSQVEESAQSDQQNTEVINNGTVQIQRKKTVHEEYEHTHKESNIEIQTSSTKSFSRINAPVDSIPNQSFHVTNPHSTKLDTTTRSTLLQASNKLAQQIPAPSHPPVPPVRHSIPPPPPALPGLSLSKCDSVNNPKSNNVGVGGGRQQGGVTAAPKRGRGVLNVGAALPGSRVALCGACHEHVYVDTNINQLHATLNNAIKRVRINERPHIDYVVSRCLSNEPVIAINAEDDYGELPDYLTYSNKTDLLLPVCWKCKVEIRRGPFITALGKIWCPQHFVCATGSCRRPLQDLGFVEENGQLYCEYCFEQYLAPPCAKCSSKIKADCLKAIGKNFHPECFNCVYCGKLFGNNPFFLEDGSPYCEADWNELFTTKCYACGFPVEAGDRWVEALNNNYHSQCFNCTMCKKNLEGQSFFAKGGRPYCKIHAR